MIPQPDFMPTICHWKLPHLFFSTDSTDVLTAKHVALYATVAVTKASFRCLSVWFFFPKCSLKRTISKLPTSCVVACFIGVGRWEGGGGWISKKRKWSLSAYIWNYSYSFFSGFPLWSHSQVFLFCFIFSFYF